MPSSASKAFQNPFFPEVIRGISSFAHVEGYALYMSTGETEDEIFNGVVKMVQGRQIGGIILYIQERTIGLFNIYINKISRSY